MATDFGCKKRRGDGWGFGLGLLEELSNFAMDLIFDAMVHLDVQLLRIS